MNFSASSLVQLGVAFTLLWVWLGQSSKPTPYRGGNAQTLREEFAVYGLPSIAFYAVGALKIAAAVCLIAGVWIPALVLPAAILLCGLMIGAIGMHLKIADPAGKSFPALALLVLSGLLVYWHLN